MLASALLFSGMSASVKLAAESLPNHLVVFIRNLLGLLFLLPLLPRLGHRGLRTSAFGEHLIRGLAGLAAMYCFFYTLAHMRLADAVLLNYSLPLFVPFIERAWLGEPVPPRLWRGILLGFLGLLFILKPGLGLFQPVALVGLLAAVLAALAQVGVRNLTSTEPTTRIVFYFSLISTVVSALPAALDWHTPHPKVWGVLLALGAFAIVAQLCLTRAYAYAPAAHVGPFIYAAVVFAVVLDWLIWRKLPDGFFAVGAVLVIAAGILALRLRRGVPAVAPLVAP
jgi:drug/metabolite transporter (DMT)-like permease